MEKRSYRLMLAVFAIGCSATAALGWGSVGHQTITGGALLHLPEPLAGYFQTAQTELKTDAGQEPPGAHYINIDYYTEFFNPPFPRNLNDLIAIYGETVVYDNGTAPWTLGDYVVSLTAAMANARTPNDWYNLLLTAGRTAHYAEDLHNPLHLTMNYNGGMTGNSGIHSRYESTMVSRKLSYLTISAAPSSCLYLASPVDTIFDEINVNYYYVDDIMTADDTARAIDSHYGTAYYNSLWSSTGTFTQALFQQASEVAASCWYTAWVNAGSPAPLYPADLNVDSYVDSGDFAIFQRCSTGAGVAYDPDAPPTGCAPSEIIAADLDRDGDVDADDFGIFQRCYSGAEVHPSLTCAN